ncbi:hypothetical protein EV184_11664 [Sinorhizobium americanum]|uniref:Uncharacterized protein n=1 Tax=Sinorhizobium americanum TaxID=194963 RepID=A0A4V2RE27_9HYPH|nr:hypothetical protein EV184_11664 [Sinorhizobium americanum]
MNHNALLAFAGALGLFAGAAGTGLVVSLIFPSAKSKTLARRRRLRHIALPHLTLLFLRNRKHKIAHATGQCVLVIATSLAGLGQYAPSVGAG